MYVQDGVNHFVTVNGRMECGMSKVFKFCLEKSIKPACQTIQIFFAKCESICTITITIEICKAPLTKWTVALNNVYMAVK